MVVDVYDDIWWAIRYIADGSVLNVLWTIVQRYFLSPT